MYFSNPCFAITVLEVECSTHEITAIDCCTFGFNVLGVGTPGNCTRML